MELRRDRIVTETDILLYNILEELKKLNAGKSESKVVKQKECKYCGGIHENQGQLLACARKHKKEGAK